MSHGPTFEHEGDQAVVVEVVANNNYRNGQGLQGVRGGQTGRSVDDDSDGTRDIGRYRSGVLDGEAGAG
ncbi:MAG: hypothetical protein AB7T06_35115, partial [Kofleriaceae bacterium]